MSHSLLGIATQATVDQLGSDLVNVVGDVVISAATIAYSGPFTPLYRAALVAEWHGFLEKAGVPASPNASLLGTLQVRSWHHTPTPNPRCTVTAKHSGAQGCSLRTLNPCAP